MDKTLKSYKTLALKRPAVRRAYERLEDEFALLDEMLKARNAEGLSQAEVAARIGTTQSAVARLESASARHSPSLATLRKYASALGYKVQVRLVKEPKSAYGVKGKR